MQVDTKQDTRNYHSNRSNFMAKKKKGIKAVFSDDGKTVTTWAYPSKGGVPYKLTQKSWKNECTLCVPVSHKAKPGKLAWNPKGVGDGELTCKQCDADFCAVTGKDKNKKVRGKLIPATEVANETTKVADSKTKADTCTLSKAEALTKAKELLKTGNDYKATLKIPIMKNIHIGDRVQINLDSFSNTKKHKLYITEIKEDIDNQTYDITLSEDNTYGTKYEGEYIVKNSKGNIIASSSSNPYQAKCENVNPNIGTVGNSTIVKKIKLKGRNLGSVKQIYKWLRVKSGGGVGGWKYKKYGGHIVKDHDEKKWDDESAIKCWSTKTANCVDFSWLMVMLCEGAGKKMGIRRGSYKNLNGESSGHMWNYYKGKNYDCSSSTGRTIDMKKVEEVK